MSKMLFDDSLSSVVVAAHELKAPLALIRQLSIELENIAISESDRALIHEQIRLISERALRLSSNLTRSSSMQIELFQTEPINVVELCKQLKQEMAPLYTAHERVLVFKPKSHTPLAISNQDLLHRIIACFTDNALHYADEHGVVELYTHLQRDKGLVRIGVRDHGPALSASLWKKLRTAETITASSHARPESSGLGLHIAHMFADVIDANIGAVRHRDGASFYVDVPLSKQLSLL